MIRHHEQNNAFHSCGKIQRGLRITVAILFLLVDPRTFITPQGHLLASPPEPDNPSRDLNLDAMWVWENASKAILENEPALEHLIDFCGRHHIREIFVSAVAMGPSGGKQPSLVKQNRYEQWENVLSKLHQAGLHVQALCGKADWLMPAGGWARCDNNQDGKEDRAYGFTVVQDILDYQAVHRDTPAQAFDGIHFDIEIETLVGAVDPNDCQPATKEDLVEWYLQFMDSVTEMRLKKTLVKERLPFDWDIHMSFNVPTNPSSIDYTYRPASGGPGVTKQAWKHFFDRFERITFMTYGDRSRYISEPMAQGLRYLDSLSDPPSVRFALEFQPVFKGIQLAPISLANEDYLSYVNLRQDITSIMVKRNYFRGWAMHPYDNFNPGDGDFHSWIEANPPMTYPSSVALTRSGQTRTVSPNPSEPLTDKVYARIRIRAHPMYRYEGSSFENFIMLIPIGYGYCSEETLEEKLDTWYDGLVPSSWWYYGHIRWWPNPQEDVKADIKKHGVGWENPASEQRPDLGIERNIVLQDGEDYRLIVHYANRDMTWGFVTRSFRALRPQNNSPDQPMPITIYLDQITHYSERFKPHLNHSLWINDSDNDGVSDSQEMIDGTNRYRSDFD